MESARVRGEADRSAVLHVCVGGGELARCGACGAERLRCSGAERGAACASAVAVESARLGARRIGGAHVGARRRGGAQERTVQGGRAGGRTWLDGVSPCVEMACRLFKVRWERIADRLEGECKVPMGFQHRTFKTCAFGRLPPRGHGTSGEIVAGPGPIWSLLETLHVHIEE